MIQFWENLLSDGRTDGQADEQTDKRLRFHIVRLTMSAQNMELFHKFISRVLGDPARSGDS